jgi:hypothetical protein
MTVYCTKEVCKKNKEIDEVFYHDRISEDGPQQLLMMMGFWGRWKVTRRQYKSIISSNS